MLQAGEVQLATLLTTDDAKKMPASYIELTGESVGIRVNPEHPVLKDVRVRQAMNLAINRPALATAIFGGKAQPMRVACFHPTTDEVLWPGIWNPAWEQQAEDLYGYQPAKAKEASPITYVSKDDPPFLVVHGTDDATVPYDQAVRFYEAEKQAGMNTTMVTMQGGGHGIGGPEIAARVKAFLDKHLLGKDITVSAEPIRVAAK